MSQTDHGSVAVAANPEEPAAVARLNSQWIRALLDLDLPI
jgi:hypothetical protein